MGSLKTLAEILPGCRSEVPPGRAVLEVRDVHLRFGGIRALQGVSFDVRRGELFAIIGPNGAGKSSMFNCLSSVYRPQDGSIEFLGHELTRKTPAEVARTGIARMFQNFDASTLRVCVSGGAALPVEVMRNFERAFGCSILEGYGLSETSPVASFNHPERERKPGSIGTPIDGVEMKAVDEDGREVPPGEVGEIAIRGHNVMKGYWRRPEATAEAIRRGWFHTGDLGRIDEDGYFFIVDRKKDMVIRGGYNVYPREIEEVLYEHPAVREAAVIGVPHPELGEEVAAAVALVAGADVEEREIVDFVKGQLAAYKYPRLVWFVDELPKGPTGKILRREVTAPDHVAAAS